MRFCRLSFFSRKGRWQDVKTLFHGLQIICLAEGKVSNIFDWKINDIDLEGKSPSVTFPLSECPM